MTLEWKIDRYNKQPLKVEKYLVDVEIFVAAKTIPYKNFDNP